jgi:D-alanyl-D-alanine carboxypeptidase (penicillin-binding protein 5/6)
VSSGLSERRAIRERERRRRRRQRRRHAILLAVLALVAGLAVLLFAFPSRTSNRQAPGATQALAPARPHRALPRRPTYGFQPAPPADRVAFVPRLPLASGLLFDVRTGEVLWSLQPSRVLPIASLTKMMTALVVLDRSKPSDSVRVTPLAVHFSGSGIGLLPLGKRVPELSLLYGLLLPSGNDAAIALAQHVAGTLAGFIKLMNQRAQRMGLSCTHFNSVSGIVDWLNHSCVGDLAIMAHTVLQNRLLGRIVGTRSAVLPFPIKGGKLYLYNNNPLLVQGYPGTDGVKTGFTTAAGRCLVATARRGRTWLGVVLLHSANPPVQAQNLLDAGFAKLGT